MQKIVALLVLVSALYAQCPDKDYYCAQCITSTNTTTTVGGNGNNTVNSTTSTCRICHGAYLGSNGVCVPPNTRYSNCTSYDSSSNCVACDYNYYLSGTNQCTPNPDSSCALYNTTQGCTACNNGRLVTNGSCNSTSPSCGTENCNICNSANQCLRCNYGYVVLQDKNYTCISDGNNNVQNSNNANITNYIPYSSCLTSVGGICTECRFGYYSLNGTCAEAQNVNQGGVSSVAIFSVSLIAFLSALLV